MRTRLITLCGIFYLLVDLSTTSIDINFYQLLRLFQRNKQIKASIYRSVCDLEVGLLRNKNDFKNSFGPASN